MTLSVIMHEQKVSPFQVIWYFAVGSHELRSAAVPTFDRHRSAAVHKSRRSDGKTGQLPGTNVSRDDINVDAFFFDVSVSDIC